MGFLKKVHRVALATLFIVLPLLCHAQGEENTEFERSSIHIMMIKHLQQRFDEVIEDVFLKSPFPERFNDHNLGVKVLSFAEHRDDQSGNIQSFSDQVNLGQKMVAKWFNRDKSTGSFNMELIKERGCYNATQSKINEARASIRGKALLEDAGENLIQNTYLLVNDIAYTSKGSANSFIKSLGAAYTGSVKQMTDAISGIGGFSVNITSYLFRLVWNDDIMNEFYVEMYTEDGKNDKEKVERFKNERNLFKLEYVGKTSSESSETRFTKSKDPSALLMKVTVRAMDKNIANLQRSYPDFRIKAPLISTEPLAAYVGLKEDVTPDSRFEVLERVLTEEGKVVYERVGEIKPKADRIMDNRYMAYEDGEQEIKATEFVKVSGKDFQIGMLIREIK